MSRFSADFATANDLLAEALGEEVVVVRGAATSSAITAQVTLQDYTGENDDGISTTVESSDFVISIDDYDLGSGTVSPRDGDQIQRTINSATHTYNVVPVPGRRCCEPDVDRDEWLIHTTHVSPSS